jgi:hypothetical protein
MGNESKGTFLERIIARWSDLNESRVLLESYLLCSFLPVVFSALPSWLDVGNGRIYRDGVVDYSMGIDAILLAPILETIFIFAPILEICRFFKAKPLWVALCFALFFELLHSQRDLFGHLMLYPTMVSMTLLYLAMRKKSFLHALLFTGVVHELYNFTVLMGNAYTYDRFFY